MGRDVKRGEVIRKDESLEIKQSHEKRRRTGESSSPPTSMDMASSSPSASSNFISNSSSMNLSVRWRHHVNGYTSVALQRMETAENHLECRKITPTNEKERDERERNREKERGREKERRGEKEGVNEESGERGKERNIDTLRERRRKLFPDTILSKKSRGTSATTIKSRHLQRELPCDCNIHRNCR